VLDETTLASRREAYGPEIPMAAAVLTAGVDIQDDRIEAELKAWGKHEESWGKEHRIFYGDTTDPKSGAWHSLDDWLQGTWVHASGVPLTLASAMIDTGHRT
jgi:phage terminase large subunit GpA-like protein